jgi:hypothetical protein
MPIWIKHLGEMKRLKSAYFVFGLLTGELAAQEIKVELLDVGGKTYKQATIKKIDETSASLMHEDGGKRVLLSQLPNDIQAQLGYDKKKEQAAQEAQEKSNKAINSLLEFEKSFYMKSVGKVEPSKSKEVTMTV